MGYLAAISCPAIEEFEMYDDPEFVAASMETSRLELLLRADSMVFS
jgi:hypothetical protein